MKLVFIASLSVLFLGCSHTTPTVSHRYEIADTLAQKHSLHVKSYKTKNFDIYAQYTKLTCKDIRVYIEGDGLSWITRSTISDNPTPITPLALHLMLEDDATCKLYLARPCQYINSPTCKADYWTSHRFSKEVIDSYNEILDSFKGKSFHLYGYSGGGTIATLLSAQRDDVVRLVSIAGNLDIVYWAKRHHITPLYGSLNPADFADKLLHVTQFHLIGDNDVIIPKEIFDSYRAKFEDKSTIQSKIYPATHTKNWEQNFKNFLEENR